MDEDQDLLSLKVGTIIKEEVIRKEEPSLDEDEQLPDNHIPVSFETIKIDKDDLPLQVKRRVGRPSKNKILTSSPPKQNTIIKEEALSDEDEFLLPHTPIPVSFEVIKTEKDDPPVSVKVKRRVGRPSKNGISSAPPPPTIQNTIKRATILKLPANKVCPVCGEVRSNLRDHLKNAHKIKSLHFCSICNHCTKKVREMNEHFLEAHQVSSFYFCEIEGCDRKFKVKTLLHKHVKAVHQQKATYYCQLCQKHFIFKNSLLSHWLGIGKTCRVCHRVLQKQTQLKNLVEGKPKPLYSCHVCLAGSRGSTAYYREYYCFKRHLKAHLQKSTSDTYKCPILKCSAVLPNFEECFKHLEDHGIDHVYNCSFCSPDKSFISKKRITLHAQQFHQNNVKKSSSYYRGPKSKTDDTNDSEKCPLCNACQKSMNIYSSQPSRTALLGKVTPLPQPRITTKSSPSESSFDTNGDECPSEDSSNMDDDRPLFDGVSLEDLMYSDKYQVTIQVE